MKKIITNTLILAIAVGFAACNKSKINSKRFMKAGEWKVTELSVDGTNEDELPHWHVEDCDIYKESCEAHWENEEGGEAHFVWQYRDKGKTYEISYQKEEDSGGHSHSHDHATEEAEAQAYNFSGVYEVVSAKKKSMEFKSTSTLGFSGQTVVIKIEKM